MVREENYDVVIVGCGVGGLYTALNLPSEDRILMICKEDIESCDSMLAQPCQPVFQTISSLKD